MKLYIATHKKFHPPKEDFFYPMHVGKAHQEDLGYHGDDTGDTISDKNQNYCELTGLYWIWKNSHSDIVGICHYRRYFDIQNDTDHINDIRFLSEEEFQKKHFSKEKIEKYLSKFDVILPKPKVYEVSLEKDYGYQHSSIDFNILTEVLESMYPDYATSWQKVIHFNNALIHYNMMIANKKLIDAYCEWLFPLLFEVEKKVKISPYDYDKRVFGFMAERLMTLYFTHHQYKVKYLPVLYVKDEAFPYRTPSKAKKVLTDWYKNFLFFLASFPRKLKHLGTK